MLRREETPPSEDESPTTVKFIKMSCKYFTDGMVSKPLAPCVCVCVCKGEPPP